jgi:hypothetical protein
LLGSEGGASLLTAGATTASYKATTSAPDRRRTSSIIKPYSGRWATSLDAHGCKPASRSESGTDSHSRQKQLLDPLGNYDQVAGTKLTWMRPEDWFHGCRIHKVASGAPEVEELRAGSAVVVDL